MQSVAGYPTNFESVEPTATVLLNGVAREVDSVSIDRELPSNLPAAVAGSSGVTAATGSIAWAEGADSSEHAYHPWEAKAFPPRTFDLVTVDTGYDGVNVRKLTGVIDGSSGSIQPGSWSAESSMVDHIDKLNQPVTIEPLLASMPPLGDLGANYTYRHIGLSSLHFTNRCLRASGFFTTPPEASGCVFSAPYVGSTWPDVGTLYKSGGTVGQNPLFYSSPWAMGVRGVDANYFPWTNRANPRLDQTMQIVAKVHTSFVANHTPSRHTIAWGTGTANEEYIRLSVQNNRAVYAQVMVGGVASDVAVMAASAAATADTFSVQVNTGGGVTIYANNGATATGTFTPSTQMKTVNADRVGVFVPEDTGIVMGGFQIAMNASAIYNHVPNANLTTPAYFRQLEWSPFIENRMALDVLKEQAEAECAAMWIDEQGIFRWRNRDLLVAGNPVETIEPLDDILSVGWEHNAASVRYRVDVSSKTAAITIGPSYSQTAYQGGNTDMKLGDVIEMFIEPESGQSWIEVDENMRLVGAPGSGELFNNGYGSFIGATSSTQDANNVDYEYVADQGITYELTRIDPQTWKLRVECVFLPADYNLQLRTPGDGFTTAFWPDKRSFTLPILRAKALVEEHEITTSGFHLGPIGAPVLQHDAGWWIQDQEELERLADWLSFQLATPSPMIRDLNVVPDDRRQLGDIVTIQFETVSLRALVVGIKDTTGTNGKSQSLTVRILTVTTGTTYDVFDEVYGSYSYNQFDTAWAAETYNTLDSDPLRKA